MSVSEIAKYNQYPHTFPGERVICKDVVTHVLKERLTSVALASLVLRMDTLKF